MFVLCDSPAVIYGPSTEPTIVLDDRLQSAGTQARAIYREHLRAGHGYGPDLKPLLAKLQQDEFKQQNQESGYWVAEATPEAVHHAYEATFQIDQVEAIVLLSDGVAAGVDEYRRPATWQEARISVVSDPAQFIAGVHGIEDTDPKGQRWPALSATMTRRSWSCVPWEPDRPITAPHRGSQGYREGMSLAASDGEPHIPAVRRAPRDIRSQLLPEEVNAFDRDYRTAMTRATEALDLSPVHEMLSHWERIAVLTQRDPERHRQMLRMSAAIDAGVEKLPGKPWRQVWEEHGY